MRLTYFKPKLKDLSQGSRISYVRQLSLMTQDEVSDKLGLTGESKRRTMARYERGDRNPKEDRLEELADMFNVNIDAIREYDHKAPIDLIYTLIWLEELYSDYKIDLPVIYYNENNIKVDKFLNEWNIMRTKRNKKEITYNEYMQWKLNYKIKNGENKND